MQPHLKREQLGVELIDIHRIAASNDGGDNGIELIIEPGEDVLNELFFFKAPACGGHLVAKCLHLADILCNTHVLLPSRCESETGVDYPCPRLRGEHALDLLPRRGRHVEATWARISRDREDRRRPRTC